ncbi:MAG: VanW family protein, partial [Actinomycetota bacterium]|nr:VanW family protein [Actinomycetota bacterium]
ALRRARLAVSAPVSLSRNGAAVTLTPAQIGDLLSTRVAHGGRDRRDAQVRLRVDAKRLTDVIGATTIAAFERKPVSARVKLRGRTVAIVPGRDGFRYDARAAAAQLREVATGEGRRSAQLAGDVVEPELTTAEARALRIVEPVSSFTTEHPCCMTRVRNIHRIADIVDGVVIQPGETFSVNDFVGRRTRAKGFVAGGAIQDGEFVEEVGGGVSQFATTLYNAAYFGGYAIPQHKRHSYYISRYPEGREATLNFPTVDLQITNSSPYGMLLETDYTDTSVTVTVWGKRWVDVSSKTSPRTNVTKGETQFKKNNDLPRGARVVVQKMVRGFDVTVTRTLRFPDGHRDREKVFTRYLPQPRIIERNRRGG